MAELLRQEYVETEDTLLIGVSNKEYGVTTHKLWDVYFGQGFDQKLAALEEYQVGMEDCIGVGYMTDFTRHDALGDTYLIGKLCRVGTPVPEGMTGLLLPGGTVARAQVGAKKLDDIIENAYMLISDMAEKNGYIIDYPRFYWMEVYTVSRFCEPMERGDKQVVLDWQLPCKKV